MGQPGKFPCSDKAGVEMTERKPPRISKKNEASIVRSSAAIYLTFVAATGKAQSRVEMRYEDENLWLTQRMMATLYDVSVSAISQHLKRIYADNELEREATVKQYLTVQAEGEREVQRKVDHYSLQAIIDFVDTRYPALLRRWDKRQRGYQAMGYRLGSDDSSDF